MFKPVFQAVQMFLKGATGRDRQAKQNISEQLLAVQIAYDQLQQQHSQLQQTCDRLSATNSDLQQRQIYLQKELDDFINFADTDAKELVAENQELQSRLRQSEDEKIELQNVNGTLLGKIAYLNSQLDLRSYQTAEDDEFSTTEENFRTEGEIVSAIASPDSSSADAVDLSNISLALIGGHETTYRKVTEELQQYGLKTCIHVPPHSIASNSRNQIKDKISQCDLVITITSYVDHSVSKCVKQLKDTQMLAGECIRVSCHGKSGLVREVLQYFANPADVSGMA
ncbi:MAG: DUF2325 domain-containing protein [Cyanobacteria bacterium J06648_10]